MRDTARYIRASECSQIARRLLKRAFPAVKFSVTTRHAASVNVSWCDGPTVAQVDAIVGRLSGSSFDAMQDLKTYHVSRHPETGETVRFGADYVFTARKFSKAFLTPIVEGVARQWGIDLGAITIHEDGAFGVSIRGGHFRVGDGPQSFTELVFAEAHRKSASKRSRAASKAASDGSVAARFRKLADALTDKIQDKRRAPTWTPTRRRLAMQESKEQDARALERLQDKLYALADAHETDSVPDILSGLRTKKQVETVIGGYWDADVLAPIGITSKADVDYARAQLLALGNPDAGAKTEADALRNLEREVVLLPIAGFFPTPDAVARRMIALLAIQPGETVLEPSAGRGDLIEAVLRAHPGTYVECYEIAPVLHRILTMKGFQVRGFDFLIESPAGDSYDKIIANPPFEDLADIDHVRHMYEHLKPGGRLVSVMSEAAFFRGDRKAVEFRAWLESVGGRSERLDSNTFLSSDRPTGVQTRLVIVDSVPYVI